MNSTESNILINFIKKKAIFIQIDKSTDRFLQFVFNYYKLYDLILQTQKIVRSIKEVSVRLSQDGNSYFPTKIQEYINSTRTYQISYNQILFGCRITLNFYVFNKVKCLTYYDESAHYVFLILCLFSQFSTNTSNKSLKIDIYMTHFKREMPKKKGDIIGPMNVNGGFTQACIKDGSITIYRKQEWFKVLIHEAMHSFCFDFSTQNQAGVNKKLRSIFPIDIMFRLFETYSEMWAEILNVSLVAFELTKIRSLNFDNFVKFFEFLMSLERYYCFFQTSKILIHLNLSYEDLLTPGNKYKEASNIFAYYICRCLLYLDYNQFIRWCHIHNTNFFNFTHRNVNILDFYNFIRKKYKNKLLLAIMKNVKADYMKIIHLSGAKNKFLRDNLRMTSIET